MAAAQSRQRGRIVGGAVGTDRSATERGAGDEYAVQEVASSDRSRHAEIVVLAPVVHVFDLQKTLTSGRARYCLMSSWLPTSIGRTISSTLEGAPPSTGTHPFDAGDRAPRWQHFW